MENSVEAFFNWKTNSSKTSVESMYKKDNKIISCWRRTDVLYSFIGIYQIGLYVFYPDEYINTGYTIKTKTGNYVSLVYLVTEENGVKRFKKYEELNKIIEDSKFIQYIDTPGNVIPIWPGGNIDKGKNSYCFDIPDIYFLKYKEWFLALEHIYPNSFLNGIIDNEFSTDDTKVFLKNMDKKSYCRFLIHVVSIIKSRNKYLSKQSN